MPRRARLFFAAFVTAMLFMIGAARASPIEYDFAGEMTQFFPPVSIPGVPFVPPPPNLQFFTGSFLYDAAGGSAAVTDFSVGFTGGGPSLGPVAAQTDTRLSSIVLTVDIDARGPIANFFISLNRPAAPGDQDGVLPATLEGFNGSFASVFFSGVNASESGVVTSLESTTVVAVTEPPATAFFLALALLGALATARRCKN